MVNTFPGVAHLLVDGLPRLGETPEPPQDSTGDSQTPKKRKKVTLDLQNDGSSQE